MSKKKASGGSTTMTLKDFHGGSIPSDLPLPSAPGVIVRPSDRAGFERQISWGLPSGRSDNRLRPGSAGAVRNFDDKTPFLNHSAQIGRNFDEDERKPLDGVSAPRRMVSDENLRAMPIRAELKPDQTSAGTLHARQVSTSAYGGTESSFVSKFAEASHVGINSQSSGGRSSYSARFTDASYMGVNPQNAGGNSARAVAGSQPNAWAARKETVDVFEQVLPARSGMNAASKLAHASALEKVSSGRWQSKLAVHHQTNVEVIGHTETDSEFNSKSNNIFSKNSYNVMDVMGGREYHDAALARHAERSLIVDDGMRGGDRELVAHERVRAPLHQETVERKSTIYSNEFQPALNDGKSGGLEVLTQVSSEPSERPKLKLLPRSKPQESSEIHIEHRLVYHQPSDSDHMQNASEAYESVNLTKTVSTGSESGNLTVDCPKLNLIHRSQPLEQSEGKIERERKTLFGGGRPRELVLKERGIDDVADSQELYQPSTRVKQDVPRTETVPVHASPTRYNEKAERTPLDHRIGKNNERRDHRVDAERTDLQRRNRRNDNWRSSSRETEKQQLRERPPSPETWRKPVEQPRTASHDAPGLRYGKAASAIELAQAFSRSVSDPKTADQFSGQRGHSGSGQMPFSRLTGPTPRPQINGY